MSIDRTSEFSSLRNYYTPGFSGEFYTGSRTNGMHGRGASQIPVQDDLEDISLSEEPEVNEAESASATNESVTLYENTAASETDVQELAQLLSARENVFSDVSFRNELETSDMRQAISDMQEDQILQQYRYFVGANNERPIGSVVTSSEDGVVIRMA